MLNFDQVTCTLKSVLGKETGIAVVRGDEDYFERVANYEISLDVYDQIINYAQFIGIGDTFKDVIETFKVPQGETPAGFKIVFNLEADAVLKVDLKRDISYDKNGKKRPTDILFSVDSANPYEIEPCAALVANLTCNPGIIYDLFINNPKANVGGKFKTRDEVMAELGRILGPGCDISVELNDPFGASDSELLEEAQKFEEMLTKYRVVIKVPHTGPVNKDNVGELLEGDKRLSVSYKAGATKDYFRAHRLALLMHDNNYRVNYTLMFEPYQTNMALQAKPYFINTFVRHRLIQSNKMATLVAAYKSSKDKNFLKDLRTFMVANDYFSANETDVDLLTVLETAEHFVNYRNFQNPEGSDGLDKLRHDLRMLRQCNLEDTRLIICSMEGDSNYPDLDKCLMEEEFSDMLDKVVITAEPGYLARFTANNQVVSYQRRFMNAAKGQK
ncbi:MAG: transaldolase family protein [Bacillota bacterium]